MNFFKKKQTVPENMESLPELPGMPRLPELPQSQKSDFSALPTLPSSSSNEEMNRGMIKSSMDFPKRSDFEIRKIDVSEKRSFERSEMPMPPSRPVSMNKEPVYVKLEKFKEAVGKFEEIKIKVSDIEGSLAKIKEIKEKEDHELKSWEEEVQLIKDKVANIDNSLFNKI